MIRRKAILIVLHYVAMGWLVIIAIIPLLESVATGCLLLLLAGGLCYTLGSVFYIWRCMPYYHAIRHVFVLAGSSFYFFSSLFYVIPLAA